MSYSIYYIVGPGHSGSTLLDMVLNTYPEIISLGEVHRLNLYARSGNLCTCGKKVADCLFWKGVSATDIKNSCSPNDLLQTKEMILTKSSNYIVNNLEKFILVLGHRRLLRVWLKFFSKSNNDRINNAWYWFQRIYAYTNSKVIIDSTKDARRGKMLYLTADKNKFKFIFLLRDGRAVSASMMRRENVSMEVAALYWKSEIRKHILNLRSVPDMDLLTVRYEDLCKNTIWTLKKISSFLNLQLEFSNDIIINKKNLHNIGGNPMRFRYDEISIKYDDKWKVQLSLEDLVTFDKIAGKYNKLLGYMIN